MTDQDQGRMMMEMLGKMGKIEGMLAMIPDMSKKLDDVKQLALEAKNSTQSAHKRLDELTVETNKRIDTGFADCKLSVDTKFADLKERIRDVETDLDKKILAGDASLGAKLEARETNDIWLRRTVGAALIIGLINFILKVFLKV